MVPLVGLEKLESDLGNSMRPLVALENLDLNNVINFARFSRQRELNI